MKIEIKKQGPIGLLADMIMWPIMFAFIMIGPVLRLMLGDKKALKGFFQRPQRTHLHNNVKLLVKDLNGRLDYSKCVYNTGDLTQRSRGWIRFHLPACLGGWNKFIVVAPREKYDWHIGWTDGKNFFGYSKIRKAKGRPVRVLIGPDPVWFVALNEKGEQVDLAQTGEGNLENPYPYNRVSLR